MPSTLAGIAVAALLALAPAAASAGAQDGTGRAQGVRQQEAARCTSWLGDAAAACMKQARGGGTTRARPSPYAASSRVRNQVYYTAAQRYCKAFSGKVRDTCVGEAALLYAR